MKWTTLLTWLPLALFLGSMTTLHLALAMKSQDDDKGPSPTTKPKSAYDDPRRPIKGSNQKEVNIMPEKNPAYHRTA